MGFEIVIDGPLRPNLIAAFLAGSPMNTYRYGFKTTQDVFASLSPHSTRSLMMRQQEDWLATGKITAEIRGEGKCD
jgi:hypothetical protein